MCPHAGTRPTTLALGILVALIEACGGTERGGGPVASPDTVLTAVLASGLTFSPEDTVSPTPLLVVKDGLGRPLRGVAVTFAVIDGGGAVEGPNVTTDANGVARPLRWLVGRTPGSNTLKASVGSRMATFSVTVPVGALPKLHWEFAGVPVEKKGIEGFAPDADIDGRWYAWSSETGVFVSTDAGATWRHVLDAPFINVNAFAIHPREHNTLLAAANTKLYVSTDRGESWSVRYTFPYTIRSILVSARDTSVYAAPQWPSTGMPGIYKSMDGGHTFTLHEYGVASGTQILTWDVFEDPMTGDLYTGNEIANHPTPYQPPVLRSRDGGVTWTKANGDIWWHVLKFGADTATGVVYAVTEGPGLYAAGRGEEFRQVSPTHVTDGVLADAFRPGWVYAAQVVSGLLLGGAFGSSSGGQGLTSIGLTGHTISHLAMNRAGTELYAVAFGEGIYKATLPSAR